MALGLKAGGGPAAGGAACGRPIPSRTTALARPAKSPTNSDAARTSGSFGMLVRIGAIACETTRMSSVVSPLISVSSFCRASNCS